MTVASDKQSTAMNNATMDQMAYDFFSKATQEEKDWVFAWITAKIEENRRNAGETDMR